MSTTAGRCHFKAKTTEGLLGTIFQWWINQHFVLGEYLQQQDGVCETRVEKKTAYGNKAICQHGVTLSSFCVFIIYGQK